jgi:Cu-processing system permease protein
VSGGSARAAGGWAVVGFALAESLRRRVVLVVGVLTAAFLVLYAIGAKFAFDEVERGGLIGPELVDERVLTGSTLFGLAMFATVFLGSVVAIFLTIGIVRGDAESGLLQPLVVRPLGRGTLIAARFGAAATASAVYVLAVYAIALVIVRAAGEWTPDHPILPGLGLALAVTIVAALSVLASVFMTSTAQGIAVFMVFGAGLVAGLLGQIGDALGSRTLERISEVATYALPFEALYQAGLYLLTSEQRGLTGTLVQLGPFGGAQDAGAGLVAWSLLYVVAVIALAIAAFGRRDL